MRHRYSVLLRPLSAAADILCLNGCFMIAHRITFGPEADPFSSHYYTLFWFFNAAWLLLLLIIKPYTFARLTFTIDTLLTDLMKLVGFHMALVSVFWVFTKGYYYSREQLLLTYLLFLFLGSFWRGLALVALKLYRAMGYNNRRFIIVGYSDLSTSIRTFYQTRPELGYKFCGYFDHLTPTNSPALRGDYSQLRDYILKKQVDCVYCCLPYMDPVQLKEIMAHSEEEGYQVKLIVDFKGFLTRSVSIEYHDLQPVISLSTRLVNDFRINIYKRIFDLGFSTFMLTVGAPIFILVALITKLTSKGPILYSQERVGQWGKPFRIYKFRSMYVDAEAQGPALSAGRRDHRITKWGRFMRKTRLDELPQFFNVLKGDMSVVGPRPERQYFIDQIVERSPEFRVLLTLKPGITSIGQIKYGYAENVEEMIQRLNYDLLYLKNVSFSYDVWLIVQTVRIMMQGRGK
ncbi:sugar transferase [Tellurirhabdus rosea]|uniref:sugar transferase n=1 Tax=Tellurirhabdus rosea TaxID=2674997 RepID=UPI00225A9306